jgi:thiamine-phosphate pyrophosphorylase
MIGVRLGFYGVVDEPAPRAEEAAIRLVAGGASAIQVRLKGLPAVTVLEAARAVARVTAPRRVLLVVNDRLDVALAALADGVHLGQEDLPLEAALRVLAASGRRLLVGISTHSPEQAERAARAGADYLGFGPVFPTQTKENHEPVQGPGGLAEAVRRAHPVPVIAIGGITPDRVGQVAATGAAGACAISAVNGAADPVSAARAISHAFAVRGA